MKFKLILPLLFLFMGIFSFTAKSQTADEIITKYFETTGGVAKWSALNSIKMMAQINQEGMEIPLEIIRMKDGKQADIINIQGKKIMQNVFDGTTLWEHNFINMKAEKKDAEGTENFKTEILDFPEPLLDYKAKGYAIELLGKEKVDGTETYKIKLTKKPLKSDGKPVDNIHFYYFDTENFLPIMTEYEIKSGPMKGQIAQSKSSDYQEVDGLFFPFSLSQGIKEKGSQKLVITKIETNQKIDPSLFIMPANK